MDYCVVCGLMSKQLLNNCKNIYSVAAKYVSKVIVEARFIVIMINKKIIN